MCPTERPLILVAGATGFVGRALVPSLVAGGLRVRALVRSVRRARESLPPAVELVEGDVVEGTGLGTALSGITLAYYLVQSMGARPGVRDFPRLDREGARNFTEAASRAGVERIVYLGGLGDDSPVASRHLASRREVGAILRSGSASTTQLRAGIIVGAESAGFEMMVQLVERLPLMLCPRWIDTRCQPIARDDLVRYLVGCAREPATAGGVFDVGGPQVLRYSEMMLRVGRVLGRRPALVVLPGFSPSLSAHWVGFITEVSGDLARPIVDGMYSEAVCREERIRSLLPFPLLSFDEAVALALAERRSRRASHLRGGHVLRPLEGRVLRLDRPRPA